METEELKAADELKLAHLVASREIHDCAVFAVESVQTALEVLGDLPEDAEDEGAAWMDTVSELNDSLNVVARYQARNQAEDRLVMAYREVSSSIYGHGVPLGEPGDSGDLYRAALGDGVMIDFGVRLQMVEHCSTFKLKTLRYQQGLDRQRKAWFAIDAENRIKAAAEAAEAAEQLDDTDTDTGENL